MRLAARLRSWLRAILRRPHLNREMRDELQLHIDLHAADLERQGLSRDEARRRAGAALGSVDANRESMRQSLGLRLLDELRGDVLYALRTLRRAPAFTAAAVATLAVTIAANTAMVSVLQTVVLQPLPYRAPEELAMLWLEDPARNLRETRAALRDVAAWRTQTRAFADLATFDTLSMTLSGEQGAEQIGVGSISPNLLTLLGINPVQGRGFSKEDAERPQGPVLISHRFWQARFGGSSTALGSTIVLDGRPSQIVGILPDGFRIASLDADVWATHRPVEPAGNPIAPGGNTWFVVGRRRPAATFAQAQDEMRAIARRLNDSLPAADRTRTIGVVPLHLYIVGPESRLALWTLTGAVFLLFLIAAANVTGLSLARSLARTREMAVRAALGAGGGRLVRQLLTESVVLALISGLIGTLMASAAIRALRELGPDTLPRLNEVVLDVRVLVWTLAISLLGGILVGVAPAIVGRRRDLRSVGEQSGRSVSSGRAARSIRRALVVAELALAIILLIGAGLLMRSWWNVSGVDPGFRPERVLVMELSAPPALDTSARRSDLFARVLDRIHATPGVERAGIVGDLFVANAGDRVVILERHGSRIRERMPLRVDEASRDVFDALGTPVRRGRVFSVDDAAGAPAVAIVNEAMARRSWPGEDAVGKRFRLGPAAPDAPWVTVVGVVADMRRQGLEREVVPQVFVPLAQSAPGSVDILIRTRADDPMSMAAALRAAVGRAEPTAPTYGVVPLTRQFGAYLTERRFQTFLLSGFSLIALLLAAVGIFGLIQYSVETRTQEFGLRQAIGASRGDILRMVIGEGLMLSLTGIALGLGGAWWLGRALSSLLFGVPAGDPLTFTVVALLLTFVSVAASYVPARRATAINPITALRV